MGKETKLSRFQLISFSAMAVPIAALGLPFVVHLPAFYKNELGISATAVGTIIMLARFWDVFTDPVFGHISDNINTRWGKRRHWIVIAVPLQMFCAWYLFVPSAGADVYYLGMWLFFIYISSTMIVISHLSWGAELSTFYHERSRVQGYREFGLIGGMLLVLALPELLGAQNRTETVYIMGMFIIIAAPLCALITLLGTPKERTSTEAALKLSAREAITFVASNKNLRRLLFVAFLAAGIAPGITGALYLDAITSVFGLGDERNLLLFVYFAAAVLSVPVWILISKAIGKHKTLGISMFYGVAVLSCSFIIPRNDFWWMFWGLILYGVVYGCAPFLTRSLMADFADQDEIENGKKRTGLCYSLLNMIDKVGIALAVGIAFPLLDLIGFDPQTTNTPETLNLLLAIYVIPATVAMLVAGIVVWGYPIDEKKQKEMQETLSSRNVS